MRDGRRICCCLAVVFTGAMLFGYPASGQAAIKIASTSPPPAPAIHGPRVVGATPGRPFLFLVPATGEGPLTFSASNLPAGISLNAKTGIITGAIQQPGKTVATLEVKGPRGNAKREMTFVAGEHCLAQTPPMGWNSWNIWSRQLDDGKVRRAADWMIKSGLAAHGYQYINIDDTWEGERDANGEILTNKKFPDMKALADYLHGKGLKIGIYSSPGPKTCAGYEGSLGHEQQDAQTYAKWDMDYLKYDWCSCVLKSPTLEDVQHPFRVMGEALDACRRDIVYSWSQGGMANVWEWGAQAGGNLWRTTGDIKDTWESMSTIGFSQAGHEPYAGPGHWNDPDMLVVGWVKWGNGGPTHLTQDEQIAHISLWSLLAAPLLIGCDLSKLDPFTTDLLCNDEVIDVDQDPLGNQASRRAQQGGPGAMQGLMSAVGLGKKQNPSAWGEVWARPLFDGTMAVGLFNRGELPGPITATWAALGLAGKQPVRDLWRRKDLGEFDGAYSADIPPHGVVLLKIGKSNRKD